MIRAIFALSLTLVATACTEPRTHEDCITQMKAHFQVVADMPRPASPGPEYWIASMQLFSQTAASADRDGCAAEVGQLLDDSKAAADDLVALYQTRADEDALAALDQMERTSLTGRVQVATQRLQEALVGLEEQGLR